MVLERANSSHYFLWIHTLSIKKSASNNFIEVCQFSKPYIEFKFCASLSFFYKNQKHFIAFKAVVKLQSQWDTNWFSFSYGDAFICCSETWPENSTNFQIALKEKNIIKDTP